jgi:serine/threonine protein kinase
LHNWTIAIIISGSVSVQSIAAGDTQPETHTRESGYWLASSEIGFTVDNMTAVGKTKVAFVNNDVFLDILGEAKGPELVHMASSGQNRGKPNKRKLSLLSDDKQTSLARSSMQYEDFQLEHGVIMIDNYAFIGTFNSKLSFTTTFGCKIIAKKLAQDARMDTKFLLEKQVMTALKGQCASIPQLEEYAQSDKVMMLKYKDVFMCDLSLAISQNVINDDDKTYYSACIYSAVTHLHKVGIMHRFINPSSIYVNSEGLPKLGDLRYSKKMDGSKSYTICGDPLYFAPEIIKQVGYDYAIDLWALGCTIYELHEGKSPVGEQSMEETQLFKAITEFVPENLEFSKKSHKKTRSVISSLLMNVASARCGYRSPEEVENKKMFSKIEWKSVGKGHTINFNLLASLDSIQLFEHEILEPCTENASFRGF